MRLEYKFLKIHERVLAMLVTKIQDRGSMMSLKFEIVVLLQFYLIVFGKCSLGAFSQYIFG